MLIEKKDIDTYLGMLPDTVMSDCMRQFGYSEDEWIVLPFLNINNNAVAINRRSETARKAIIMLKNGEKIILKEIPWYCSSIEFTKYEISFQKSLMELNCPIPYIYITREGTNFCTVNYNGMERYSFAQKFQDGESWKASMNEYISMATILAIFHKKCYRLTDSMIFYNPPKSNVFVLAQKMLDVAKQNICEVNRGIVEFERYYTYDKNQIEQYKKEAEKQKYFETMVPVHGDFNPWNLIFSNTGEVLAIVDFDNSIIDNPVHDLSEALVDVCFFKYKPNTTRFKDIPKEFLFEKAKLFLETYEKNLGSDLFPLVPCVSAVITIELVALAIARFDYNVFDVSMMFELDQTVYNNLKKVLEVLKDE